MSAESLPKSSSPKASTTADISRSDQNIVQRLITPRSCLPAETQGAAGNGKDTDAASAFRASGRISERDTQGGLQSTKPSGHCRDSGDADKASAPITPVRFPTVYLGVSGDENLQVRRKKMEKDMSESVFIYGPHCVGHCSYLRREAR